MNQFTPHEDQHHFDDFLLPRMLNRTVDETKPRGNFALNDLTDLAFTAQLLDRHDVIRGLIERDIDWLNYAIQTDEASWFSGSLHRASLYEGLGLILWLKDLSPATDVWANALHAQTLATESYSKSEMSKDYLDRYLAYCLQAEQYAEGIVAFETYHGEKEVLKKKTPLKPREYAYLYCKNKLNPTLSNAEIQALGKPMLTQNMEESTGDWMRMGLKRTAAMWLKIVYWQDERTLTAQQVILKAYDHLPSVERPSWASK